MSTRYGRDDSTDLPPKQEETAPALSGRPASGARVFVKSYGCQMNAYDSTRIADLLAPRGYAETATVEEADLIVLNTCHIRERASEKTFSELGKMRQLKAERAGRGLATKIVVAGCVAQAEGAEIVRRQSAVDLVVGPQNYHRLPDLLARAEMAPGIVDTDFPLEDKFDHLVAPSAARIRRRGVSAFATVQEGCDKFCSFCVVPYTRGSEMSRPVEKILAEIETLAEAGVREVTLLGQNVNAYHGEGVDGDAKSLAQLLRAVAEVPGILRLRYMTSHPNDMSDDLIAAHGDLDALMPFLHLPVQSGSDRILASMNRRHGAADYLRLVERIRTARPDIALSSDFIIGFPGETEADFAATLALAREVQFASSFFFNYSQRPGTPAADRADLVAPEVMAERFARLQELLDGQRRAFNRSFVGSSLDVLFEKLGRYPGQIIGKSPYLQPVHVEAPAALIGMIGRVDIVGVEPNSLVGRLSDDHPDQAVPASQSSSNLILTEGTQA